MPIDIASGNVHLDADDVFVPGSVDLAWDRHYQASRSQNPAGLFGPGWHGRYEISLLRTAEGFEFVAPDGSSTFLASQRDEVERQGGIARHTGAAIEVFADSGDYIVQCWNVESSLVWRYRFARAGAGAEMLPSAVEDVTGRRLELVRDRAGRLTALVQTLERRRLILEYEDRDRVSAVSLVGADRSTVICRYSYDETGRLSAVIDPAGHVDRYEYDEKGRLCREIRKSGGVFSYRYDGAGRCVFYTGLDRYDQKRLKYIDAARTTEITDSYNNTRHYRWNANGQITDEWGPLGDHKSAEYDEAGRLFATVDALGGRTAYEYDDAGNRSRVTDALGQAFDVSFNDAHLPQSLLDPNGHRWTRSYDDANRLTESSDPSGATWRYRYTTDGCLESLTNPAGATRRFTYQSGVLASQTDWQGNVQQLRFDMHGRIVARVDAVGSVYRYVYDTVGNLVRFTLPDGLHVRASYNADGSPTEVIDSGGNRTVRVYGTCRRLLERHDPNGGSVVYSWGTEPGRLDKVVNGEGAEHLFFYDPNGRCVRERTFDGRDLAFEFDHADNCIRTRNGGAQAIELERDALGRVVRQTLPDGESATVLYDKLGNLTDAVTQTSAIQLQWDSLGRLVRESQNGHWIEYQPDELGRVSSLTTDLGLRLDYDWDENGRCRALGIDRREPIEWQRDATGAERQRTFPGGVRLLHHYDSQGRVAEQQVLRPAASMAAATAAPTPAPVVRRSYSRDSAGWVSEIRDDWSGTLTFQCDPGGRLVAAGRDAGLAERFEYDAADNWTRHITTADGVSSEKIVTCDRGGRLVAYGDVAYEFDSQGRLARRTERDREGVDHAWRYEWDALDRLRAVERPDGATWRYTYDALSRRVAKEGPSERIEYVWRGDVPLHELSTSEGLTTWIVDEETFAPIAIVRHGQPYPIVTDHLGTPQDILSRGGEVVWRLRTSAFGAAPPLDTDVDCPFRFPGQSFDEESGFSYNRYRYYDPQSGRYIAPDPLGIDGGLNLYQYSINPARWIDPFGLAVCPAMYERYKKFRELGFSPKDAKALAEHPTNVVSPQRTAHILIGDATGGGHMNPPQPGKTGFPPGWDASKIMHEVSDIATSPTSTFTRPDGRTDLHYRSGVPARFTGTETRDGVPIKVVTEPAGEGVITAHPI